MRKSLTYEISFGDCDPAGIVFYPNIFRWMDAAFHNLLKPAGGHTTLCKMYDASGIGLVNSSARFLSPMQIDDVLEVYCKVVEWSDRSMTLAYEGHIGEKLAFEGKEVRCLFVQTQSGISAGSLEDLRNRLEESDG